MDPLLNGKIERKSDHLLDLPRAQLSDAINIVAVNRYFAIPVLHCGIILEGCHFGILYKPPFIDIVVQCPLRIVPKF